MMKSIKETVGMEIRLNVGLLGKFAATLAFPIALGIGMIPASFAQIERPLTATDAAKEARISYQKQDYSEAVQRWQQAVNLYQEQGDRLNLAMALSNLSLTWQQLGEWQAAQQVISESLSVLQFLKSTPEQQQILAQTLDIQGRFYWQTGNPQKALDAWQNSRNIYQERDNHQQIHLNLLNQSKAWQDLGLYPKACQSLLEALTIKTNTNSGCNLSDELLKALLETPDSQIKIEGFQGLGNLLRLTGQLEPSRTLLEAALQVAQKQKNSQSLATLYLSLGNTERAIAQRTKRLEIQDSEIERVQQINAQRYRELLKKPLSDYQQAIQISPYSLTRIQAQLNQLSILIESEQMAEANTLANSLTPDLLSLSPSRTGIYAQIQFSKSLLKLNIAGDQIVPIIQNAIQQAEKIGDRNGQAFALATLGNLYEKQGNWTLAERLTRQGLSLISAYNSPDIAYQLFWQLGRIYRAKGDLEQAILAYNNAYQTLQSLRGDLVTINSEVQFSFRESVEPVYREFVDLQLQKASLLQQNGQTEALQNQLKQVRQILESLQLAELNNFFRDACVDANPTLIDEVAQTAATIYPIILKDRLEIIVSVPGEVEPTFYLHRIPVSQGELTQTLRQLRALLIQPPTADQRALPPDNLLRLSQQVYQWLIQPLEADFVGRSIQTLVFVLDGELRNIPMGALYDGQEYLAEKYAIALTPGLQLLNPQPLTQEDLIALLGGATDSPLFGSLGSLPAVDEELNKIEETLPEAEKRENEQFTTENLQALINQIPFSVVHLATHGQFSSNPEQTFILTYNDKIDVKTLEQLLQNPDEKKPIELLVLSACETVKGDDRAALGLAGIAVRAGARSTLATLWTVDDTSTAQLMVNFYQELVSSKQNLNKAQALQNAQKTLLNSEQYRHPYYWSPFILVGNWQ